MSNEELYKLVLEHFENVDKLAELLEEVALKLKEMDLRLNVLEGKKPTNDNKDDREWMSVLA